MNDKSENETLLKAAKYCAYQERCHKEVRTKLAEWGIMNEKADLILSQLIEQKYLDEERFAKAFAGGKFRVKQWGRLKIRNELQVKGVSDYCIRVGLMEIDEESYREALSSVVKSKMVKHGKTVSALQKNKAWRYAAGKGYESDLIWEVIKQLEQTG